MSAETKEASFESHAAATLAASGWEVGDLADWEPDPAMFPKAVLAYLEAAQPKLWASMRNLHGAGLETQILAALGKELDAKGTLHVLRHGFKFFGKTFRMATFRPAHGLNEAVGALYDLNRLTVTRQARCHPGKGDELDLLLALNGLPIATVELKNPGTSGGYQEAIRQYRETRDPNAPLFRFKRRALVHFAVDPNEVHMTTRLQAAKTHFLPFNRGSHPGEVQCGKGNPEHPSGYRVGYFFGEVLERDRFLDILGHYMFVETKEEKVDDGQGGAKIVRRETMVFPRYHQLDAVGRLVRTARAEGAGRSYLVQHSAGSGKTNSISWLSHRLASLHNEADEKTFDCVVVITDRRVLDQQLQDAIYQIEHAQGVVKAIDEDSKQLADALIDGTAIVITTLQKFPFVLRGLLRATGAESREAATPEQRAKAKAWEAEIARRNYAVIVDEAHSSQSGETARELKGILGTPALDVEFDGDGAEDALNAVMASRGPQANLSFFAFTATPKGKTMELFGRVGASGKPEAFHVYSMRQAIEEGFILDVLTHYTTYKTYYRLQKAAAEDPDLPKRKAATALAKFMTIHAYNIEQKTAVMVEHFREHVAHQLGGRAKAMVVAGTRLHAVRYMQAFTRYIEANGIVGVRPLVAFSGTVHDHETGFDYTEPGMNKDVVTGLPIGEAALPERFASSDYNVLLVANKYQTGFDQPLLHTMYVDRRLDGVQAVQTLSRLNRMVPGKETPFVLDFVNEAEDIYRAFKPYYDTTELEGVSDPAILESLKHELNGFQIYHAAEVEGFAAIFYKALDDQKPADHAKMQGFLQPSVTRFKALGSDEARKEFRDKLSGYVRLYSFLSQIVPYADAELEKLYSFGKLLLPYLPLERDAGVVDLGGNVDLAYYRLQRLSSGAIKVKEGAAEYVASPSVVGTGNPKEERAPLSQIIQVLNDRFGTEFREEDRLFLAQIHEKAVQDPRVIQTAEANTYDRFHLGMRKVFEGLIIERHAGNDKIVTRILADEEFNKTILPMITRTAYDAIRTQESHPPVS